MKVVASFDTVRRDALLAVLKKATAEVEAGIVDGIAIIGVDRSRMDNPEAYRTIFWYAGVSKIELVGLATHAVVAATGM